MQEVQPRKMHSPRFTVLFMVDEDRREVGLPHTDRQTDS